MASTEKNVPTPFDIASRPKKTSSIDSKHTIAIPFDPLLLASSTAFGEAVLSMNLAPIPIVEKIPAHEPAKVKANIFSALDDEVAAGIEESDEEEANEPADIDSTNLTRTTNADLAHVSALNPLVDLFNDMGALDRDGVTKQLDAAWAYDKDATLKIIFNRRSIHLGSGDRKTFYDCCSWLAAEHPRTLLANLKWLTMPVIEKPQAAGKKVDGDDDAFSVVEAEDAEESSAKKNGMSHGYWKDLLNMLVLAVNSSANPDKQASSAVLKSQKETKKRKRVWDEKEAKALRDARKSERHVRAVNVFKKDPFYRVLHLTVARLFAEQLKTDKALLDTGDKLSQRTISLAAKWAPTLGGFHDQHTFITSSIAEILFPRDTITELDVSAGRELYLKHAREKYRCYFLSPLRRVLEVVEREITAKTFENIKYPRVPSLAMQRYTSLFIQKDTERFDKFLDRLASGKATISGAVLLPSTLVAAARGRQGQTSTKKGLSNAVAERERRMQAKVVDGQWNTLVKRIKDSGTLTSAIAVCDVSGSMSSPVFPDKTCPMHSAIGLSLLLAEVCQPPFGGQFITFSSNPTLQQVGGPDDKRNFAEKVAAMERTEWGMSTDFEAAFTRLILPLAVHQEVKPEDMVKTVFVFSDMEFNGAAGRDTKWLTSYERIKAAYSAAGYEVPQLVFWNLAGGRGNRDFKPKSVTSEDEGTALVSGYSQAQMKVFLDGGGFEGPEDDVVMAETEEGEDGVVEVRKEKKKIDPLALVVKAISHEAYQMLTVVD